MSVEIGKSALADLMEMLLNAGSSRSQMASRISLMTVASFLTSAGSSHPLKSSFLFQNASGVSSNKPSNNYSKVAIAGAAIGCSATSSKSSNSMFILALMPKMNAGAIIISFCPTSCSSELSLLSISAIAFFKFETKEIYDETLNPLARCLIKGVSFSSSERMDLISVPRAI